MIRPAFPPPFYGEVSDAKHQTEGVKTPNSILQGPAIIKTHPEGLALRRRQNPLRHRLQPCRVRSVKRPVLSPRR
jgi:hypothetical protein